MTLRSALPFVVTMSVRELFARFGSGALLSMIDAVRSYGPVLFTVPLSARFAAAPLARGPIVQMPEVSS